MLVMAVLIQTVCAVVPIAEVRVMVLFGVTMIVPIAFAVPQPPDKGML